MKFVFLFLVMFSLSCGDDDKKDDSSSPPLQPSPAEVAFTDLKPLVVKSCGGGSCHTSGNSRDKVIVSSQNFLGSKSCAYVVALKMPKPASAQAGAMTDDERKEITDYCSEHRG